MRDPIVGIDLGTSNSVVAHVDGAGHAKVLADDGGYKIHPSVVSFHPNGGVVVGAAAKQRKVIDPQNTIYSVKRLIGRAFDSPEVTMTRKRVPFQINEGANKLPMIATRGGEFAVPEVSAIVLDHVRNIAQTRLGVDVARAVVTVPASFNDAQRSATATAGAIAGLTVARVLNEPTAAALAYGHSRNLREVIAVFDFGGGTFDISLLRIRNQVYEVIGTAGDTFLGGDDLDERLVDRMVAKFLAENRLDLRSNEISMMRLRAVAEQTKIELSRRSRAVVRIDEIAYGPKGVPLNLQIEITRDEFVRQVADIIDRTFPVCQEALTLAGIGIESVADVILVGGTTKIPYVRDQVAKFFARAPRTDVNPEDAVAIGAALQASTLDDQHQRPRTSTQVPAAIPPMAAPPLADEEVTETRKGFSLDEVTRTGPGRILELGSDSPSVTMAPSEVSPPVVPPRRTTAEYGQVGAKRPLDDPKPDTSYSVTRGGARDAYEAKPHQRTKSITSEVLPSAVGEISRPAETTKPGVQDPYDARTPIGRMPRQGQATPPPLPVVGKKTAFGVPAGPATDTHPGLGSADVRPSGRAFSESDNFTGEGPAFTPGKPPAPPLRAPSAPTLVALAPDFAAEVESASFGGETNLLRDASAASTAKGMGPAMPPPAAAQPTLVAQPYPQPGPTLVAQPYAGPPIAHAPPQVAPPPPQVALPACRSRRRSRTAPRRHRSHRRRRSSTSCSSPSRRPGRRRTSACRSRIRSRRRTPSRRRSRSPSRRRYRGCRYRACRSRSRRSAPLPSSSRSRRGASASRPSPASARS
ncbi:MAG: Hsp70 family protein [Deltaproteobacteria bacterium]|nr:Hsp70 family protein [Deltaproteobacteria bacterium]